MSDQPKQKNDLIVIGDLPKIKKKHGELVAL